MNKLAQPHSMLIPYYIICTHAHIAADCKWSMPYLGEHSFNELKLDVALDKGVYERVDNADDAVRLNYRHKVAIYRSVGHMDFPKHWMIGHSQFMVPVV